MIALGANYHLSCLAVLANCTRQHNDGKVTRKEEKRSCQSITLAELISHKQSSRTRQPPTTDFKLSQKAWQQRNKRYTLHVLLTADTQVKEVLLMFDEHIG